MKRYLALVTVLIVTLTFGFMMGCDSDPSSIGGVNDNEPATIELRVTHSQIRGYVGEERSETVTAIARNASGLALPGVKIKFGIRDPQLWKGTISTASGSENADADTVTNQAGEMKANYSVILDRSTAVVIDASYGQVSNFITINVEIADDNIGQISIEAPDNLSVPPNQSLSTDVTASVVDTDGLAIQGIQVKFRADPPSLGSIDSDTGTTDVNGRVTKAFNTRVNRSGACTIFATVGDFTDSTTIEISPRALPADIQIYTPTPEITVIDNQNAQVEIIAVVNDDDGVGVPNAIVKFELLSASGAAIFGSITPRDTTDANGQALTYFNTYGGSGKLRVQASVLFSTGIDTDIDPAELELNVTKSSTSIRALNVSIQPGLLDLSPDSTGEAMVYVRVIDQQNNGIPNMPIAFESDYGTIARGTSTDSTGLATAEFYFLPQTDFPGYPDVETRELDIEINASIRGTEFAQTRVLQIKLAAIDNGTLALTTDKTQIYADNGLTVAKLTAVLKDADNQSLSGEQIIFTSTHGSVNSPVLTDSIGIARAVFTDIGLPSVENGIPVPSVVTAKYSPMSLQSQVEIMIDERNPVATITLRAGGLQLQAGSGDSLWVGVVCLLENGTYAPEGTEVHFTVQADMGRFVNNSVHITGNQGAAENFYIAGNTVGTAILTAWVDNDPEMDGDEIYSNEISIDLLPGPPNNVRVQAAPNRLQTNDPEAFSAITATVTDTANNPVEDGTLVGFTTTLGALERAFATTEGGRAVVNLSPGVEAGVAEVVAQVAGGAGPIEGRTTVTFVASGPNSIQLTADPLEIAVAGTGQLSTATLTASVYDANGNLIETAVPVVFELMNEPPEPAGCNINNQGQRVESLTSGGRARASLNSGQQSGGKLIRAYTWRDENHVDTVEIRLSTVAVVSGPPFALDVDVNNMGENRQGGAWAIEVSAKVWDLWRNPVANDIPVTFTVDPEVAHIGAGHTGNENLSGTTTRGVAFTQMVYNSVNTFDTLTITGEVNSPEGAIQGAREHVLPLQDGTLTLNCDPLNWMIDQGPDTCLIRCWVVLKDGHEVEINNGPIIFNSTRARFFWYNNVRRRYEMFFPDPARKHTGWRGPEHNNEHNEEDGQATVFLRGTMGDFFLDPVTPEVNVQITAYVEGYDDVIADPKIVSITRHP